MKFQIRSRSECGTTLLVSLWSLLIIVLALAVYMRLTVNHNQLAARSEVWNACMPVLEAGVEDALTHCFYNSTNMPSNGWLVSSNRCNRTNTVGDGYYEVSISTNSPFDIVSSGYYPMPGSSKFVSRKVRVVTEAQPFFDIAIVAKNGIVMNGNPVLVDSFNSSDPTRSTNGRYDPAKAGDHADAACLNPKSGAFDIGNANLWGHAIVALGGAALTAPNGAIGSVAWQRGGNTGVEPKWQRTDNNMSLPAVSAPFAAAATPRGPGLVNGVSYTYVFDGGNFLLATLDKPSVVTADSKVYVTGVINLSLLNIRSNATLRIYAGGPSASFGTISNESGLATSLTLFGLPTLTSLDLGDNWMGAIDAPNAAFKISGGTQVTGCAMVKTFSMSGNSQFHYDEALASTNRIRAFIVTSWNEL